MITTYNIAPFIEQTLESVLAQKMEYSYEVLIGDDGSADGTLQLLEKWQAKYPEYIQIFVMDRDQNVKYDRIERASKNRLNLLKHARGQYLAFLDGDDFYTDSTKFQKQLSLLEKPEYQSCVACTHDLLLYWNENKSETGKMVSSKKVWKAKNFWRNGCYACTDTIVFRNLFSDGDLEGLIEDYYDDNMIAFSVLDKGDILCIPEVMAAYRQTEGSTWNSIEELEKAIINLMDLDVELRLRPSWASCSYARHIYNVFYLWRHYKSIPPQIKEKYMGKALKDQLKNTLFWLSLDQQGRYKKFLALCKTIFLLFRYSPIILTRIFKWFI